MHYEYISENILKNCTNAWAQMHDTERASGNKCNQIAKQEKIISDTKQNKKLKTEKIAAQRAREAFAFGVK